MSPAQLFQTIGDQVGEVAANAKQAEASGYGIEKFTLETQFEINSSLKQTNLPKRQSYLDGGSEGPLFKVKIVVY